MGHWRSAHVLLLWCCRSSIHCMGTTVMNPNNRIGRRERREILKSMQGLGEGVVMVDKGQVEPLRPNAILQALEEMMARRYREGHMWPRLPRQFWVKPG